MQAPEHEATASGLHVKTVASGRVHGSDKCVLPKLQHFYKNTNRRNVIIRKCKHLIYNSDTKDELHVQFR